MTPIRLAAPIELVIFDLDGVLVDTQGAETAALRNLAELCGVVLEPAAAEALFGGKRIADSLDCISSCDPSVSIGVDAEQWVRAETERLIGTNLEPIEGATEALAALDVPVCVASNSPLTVVHSRLDKAKLRHFFGDHCYSAYDVGSWKPDPGVFLWAAKEHQTAPARCLVIEDTLVGVRAAQRAGMHVIRYQASATDQVSSTSVATIRSLSELPMLLDSSLPLASEGE